jgi:DnaJ like chaperone protein
MMSRPPPLPNPARRVPPPFPAKLVLSPLLLALIPILAKFCKADGVVSKPEVDLVDSFFSQVLNLTHEERRSAISLFRVSKATQVSFGSQVEDFAGTRPDQAIAHMTIDLLMAIALTDETIARPEEDLLSELVAGLGLADSSFHEFVRERDQHQRATSRTRTTHRSECFDTLGVADGCSLQEIKAAYRSMATQYHPDRVQHLGPKLREVAENEMQRINEAYSYLTQKGK